MAGQGGCEREELKFVFFFWGGGSGGGVRWGVGLVGVRMDVNALFGVGGDVGYGVVNQE